MGASLGLSLQTSAATSADSDRYAEGFRTSCRSSSRSRTSPTSASHAAYALRNTERSAQQKYALHATSLLDQTGLSRRFTSYAWCLPQQSHIEDYGCSTGGSPPNTPLPQVYPRRPPGCRNNSVSNAHLLSIIRRFNPALRAQVHAKDDKHLLPQPPCCRSEHNFQGLPPAQRLILFHRSHIATSADCHG